MNYINKLIHTTPFRRFAYAACLSSPVIFYYPIRSALLDRSDAIKYVFMNYAIQLLTI